MGFEGLSAEQRRRVLLVAAIGVAAFLIEIGAGALGGSQALLADGLDFLAVALAAGLGLWAVGKSGEMRVWARLLETGVPLAFAAWVGLTTLYQFFFRAVPEPSLMAAGGLVGLAANGAVLYLLQAERKAGATLRPMWMLARNDMIGNGTVMLAAGLIVIVDNSVPDLVVAGVMVALFLTGTYKPALAAWREWQAMQLARQAADKHEG
jgi:Co/Zn/Cd efflux system component